MPDSFACDTNEERIEFLFAYVHTYLKEEIWSEHFIGHYESFRRF